MENNNKKYIIALDGPSGSGKSSLAKSLAKCLNITYIDTGAMYRAITFYFIKNNIDFDEEVIINKLDDIKIEIKYENLEMRVLLNGEDVTGKIRTVEVTKYATQVVSKIKKVREKMVLLQRKMAENSSVILDGRDIGTVVFPNADLKIFLNALVEVRAKRRKIEFETKGEKLSLEDSIKHIQERDYIEYNRKESPLKKADDAIEVDTSNLTLEETLKLVLNLIHKRIGD